MPSSQLTTYSHTNTLNTSIFPSLTHLPEELDSYAVNTWVRTGYWPWMSESSPQIPANTPARLVKTTMNDISLPAILGQSVSGLKRKRLVSRSEGSTVALYQQLQHFSCEYGTSSEGEAEDDAIRAVEVRTESPALQARVLEEDEVQEKSETPLLQAALPVSLTSTEEQLDQELLQLAASIFTPSGSTSKVVGIKTREARTVSPVITAPNLDKDGIEDEPQPLMPKERPPIPLSEASTNLSHELRAPSEKSESSASPEASTSTTDVLVAAMESRASRRQRVSALPYQSLLSTQAASPPQGVSFYFHFRETWSNFGTCMEEDPDLESYVPEVDGHEVRWSRVDDVTGMLLDGLNRMGDENSHREKVERARLGVEFWREGRSQAKGLSVLIWKEGVRMFIVRQIKGN